MNIHTVNKRYFYRCFVDCEMKKRVFRRLFNHFDAYHCFFDRTHIQTKTDTQRKGKRKRETETDKSKKKKINKNKRLPQIMSKIVHRRYYFFPAVLSRIYYSYKKVVLITK